jgi:hypothetical protein
MRKGWLRSAAAWLVGTLAFGLIAAVIVDATCATEAAAVRQLAGKVARHGWIVFAAHAAEIRQGKLITDRNGRGQLDLYLARPDGSELKNLTHTDDLDEFGAQFSPDGRWLLYRRRQIEGTTGTINHDQWGAQGELVLAAVDGSNRVVYGTAGQYPWATFGPDTKEFVCLYKKEGLIRFIDVATKKVVRQIPAQGIFQQLFWSADGKRLVGTANLAGRRWNVVSIDLATGRRRLLTRVLNCTPDWFQGDPERIIYSYRNPALFPGQYDNYGLTMLMQVTADGKHRKLVYGKAGKHVYFGCTSPDDKYVIFSDDAADTMIAGDLHVIRLADTPILPPGLEVLKRIYPNAKEGPVLDLKLPSGVPLRGFEPHWTSADVGAGK